MPIIPFIPKSYTNKEKEKKNEKKDEKNEEESKNKIISNPFIQTSIFINPINKFPKDYNKFQYRKIKPFGERAGDWICKNCRNLNFAFRIECNRCKLPKKEAMETQKNKENKENKENKIKIENNISENDTALKTNLFQNDNIFNFYNNRNQNKKNNKYKNYHLYHNENSSFKNKDCSNNYEEK